MLSRFMFLRKIANQLSILRGSYLIVDTEVHYNSSTAFVVVECATLDTRHNAIGIYKDKEQLKIW